jgi:hypothetical protein
LPLIQIKTKTKTQIKSITKFTKIQTKIIQTKIPNIQKNTKPKSIIQNQAETPKSMLKDPTSTISTIKPAPAFLSHKTINEAIQTSTIFPKDVPVQQDIGKSGLMWPRALANKHQAAPLLSFYSKDGCPTNCGPNWSIEHIEAALLRGPHTSAKSKAAKKCLMKETEDKIKDGYAKIVKWKDIKANVPPQLKISPVAMIPHKSRQFRAILDLSFQLRMNGEKQPSVNSATKIQAPQKAMAELGQTLKRIVYTMALKFNKDNPFVFSKCDIKDGFWRMTVNSEDAWNFCYSLPVAPGTPLDEIQIVIPHSLQMGWCESPPFFCAATETGRDIIHNLVHDLSIFIPPHSMEHHILKDAPFKKPTEVPSITQPTTNLVEVFVDDFIGCTNNLEQTHLERFARALLHGIHSIFPPTSVSGHHGGDPISEKKMLAGDGQWAYKKEILGWVLDGKNYTLELPDGKAKKIQILIKALIKRKSSALSQFQTMAGKLQHAAFGLPGGKGLFSPIYNAMKGDPTEIPLTPELVQTLQDWRVLLQQIDSRPTSVLELMPKEPWYIGYCDACGFGAGGVWISGTKDIIPIVWRIPFPPDVEKRLVSTNNPNGDITNSDLEMAGVLFQWLILEQVAPIKLEHANIGIFCDNTPTVAWARRLHSSKSKIAGHLLRALAIRQHAHRTSPLLTISIAGEQNNMADVASRSFREKPFTSSHQPFATSFTNLFPLPQQTSWTECRLEEKLTSRVTSCLRGEQLQMALWLKIPRRGKNTGLIGKTTALPSSVTHISSTVTTQKKSSSSQPMLLGSGQVTTATSVKSKFRPFRTRFQPSPRQLNWLENRPLSTKQKKHTKSQWHGLWKECDEKTQTQSLKSQSLSVYQPNVKNLLTQLHAPKHKQLGTLQSLPSSTSSELENTQDPSLCTLKDGVKEQQGQCNSQLETLDSSNTTKSCQEQAHSKCS